MRSINDFFSLRHSRGDQTIMLVAAEVKITHYTLRYSMKKKSALTSSLVPGKEKRPSD